MVRSRVRVVRTAITGEESVFAACDPEEIIVDRVCGLVIKGQALKDLCHVLCDEKMIVTRRNDIKILHEDEFRALCDI